MKPLSACVLLLAISPALRAELKLENARFTFGEVGPARSGTQVLPGDELTMAFTMTGLAKDAGGHVNLSLVSELVDEKGKSLAKMPPRTLKALVALGGTDVPGVLSFSLPLEFPAGKYRVRGVVKDLIADVEATTERAIEVLPAQLGIVRLRLSNDAAGQSPSGGNVTAGQGVHIQCLAVGFAHKDKRIHLTGSMRVLDAAGKSTFPKPLSFVLDQEAPDEVNQANFKFALSANRPGRYTIQIEAQDKIAGKTATQEIPLVVHAPLGAEEDTRRTGR